MHLIRKTSLTKGDDMKKTFKISKLIGPELDMAVAIALGYIQYSGPWWHHKDDANQILNITTFSPSTNGEQGIDIIDNGWIGLDRPSLGQTPPVWRALADFKGERRLNPLMNVVDAFGPTALIAAMRAKVASIYGDSIELDIPRTKRAI